LGQSAYGWVEGEEEESTREAVEGEKESECKRMLANDGGKLAMAERGHRAGGGASDSKVTKLLCRSQT